jgi:hypothetical protein
MRFFDLIRREFLGEMIWVVESSLGAGPVVGHVRCFGSCVAGWLICQWWTEASVAA